MKLTNPVHMNLATQLLDAPIGAKIQGLTVVERPLLGKCGRKQQRLLTVRDSDGEHWAVEYEEDEHTRQCGWDGMQWDVDDVTGDDQVVLRPAWTLAHLLP